jgi:alanine racemase
MTGTSSDTSTVALVDLGAIRHNIGVVRGHVGPGRKIAAVVKADGYGHGSVAVARACLEAGAEMLCVARPQEGVELREQLPSVPILVFAPASPSELEAVVHFGLSQAVDDDAVLSELDRTAGLYRKRVSVHIEVDTGMNRTGVMPHEAVPFARRVRQYRNVELEGVYSHFATAGEKDPRFAREQLLSFLDVVAELAGCGIELPLRHMANSAAVLALPESHLDMVRPGVMIYGLKPAPHLGEGLEPAMTVLSHILKLKTVPAGTPVSYGCTYRCSRQQEIATVPMGYADGYRRGLSNRFHVVVRGQRAPVVGRVCMDMLMADVTDVPGVEQGDEVLILGKRDGHCVPAEQMAATLDTIPQEVVSRISRRLRRVYTDGKA